jgi:hypothetical protein
LESSDSVEADYLYQGGAMDELRRFLEESPIAARVALPASVVLRRLSISPEEAASAAESGNFSPSGGEGVCELEVGGQCVARGRIVRRRGKSFFKVVEINEGASR